MLALWYARTSVMALEGEIASARGVGGMVVRILFAGTAGLVLLTGCVSGPGLLSNDVREYGVRVIRPGMSEREVRDLVGAGESAGPPGAGGQTEVSYRGGLHVKFDAGVVDNCWAERVATAGKSAIDPELAAVMTPGIGPADLAVKLGPPTFGYATKNGGVVLHYAGRGVEVSYNNRRLISWWPTAQNALVAQPAAILERAPSGPQAAPARP